MGWYKKALFKESWGQIPLIQDPERLNDDAYQKTPPYGRQHRKKDMLQDSLGFGSSEHQPEEISGEDSASEISGAGRSDRGVNSLTSGYDDIVYKGEIYDEGPGADKPRTEFQNDRGDPPSVLGMEPTDYTPDIFLKDNTPEQVRFQNNSKDPRQVAIQNALRDIHSPKHKKVQIGNASVNVL